MVILLLPLSYQGCGAWAALKGWFAADGGGLESADQSGRFVWCLLALWKGLLGRIDQLWWTGLAHC